MILKQKLGLNLLIMLNNFKILKSAQVICWSILIVIFLFNFHHAQDKKLSATTNFSVKELNGVWWLINPEGKQFFSSGVCCVNTGASFEDYSYENPGYSAWQHFSDPMEWAEYTIDSLKSWGFTTIGGWSSTQYFTSSPKQIFFNPVMAMGMDAGAPWYDMWDSTVVKRIEQIARERILPVKDSPNLIGYYTDNEMGWWNAALWNMTLKNPATSIARQKMIELISDHYKNSWNDLLKDFDPENANSFDELKNGGHLYLRPGGNGIFVVRQFVGMIAERYYSLTKKIVCKYDKKGLILGDRYQSFYYPEVAKAASKYVDVVSTNLNANWNDGTFTRCYLSTLYELTRKPIAIGEYYMAANENRSGNKNSSATFPTVQTQKQRADGFIKQAEYFSQTPFVVMADWFQFFDEPTHGRDDGEDYNMGLIDIHGKPYEELVNAAGNFDWEKHKANPITQLPDASEGIPPAPKENIISPVAKEILQNWDRQHGFVKSSSHAPLFDMYLCWTTDTLYLALYGDDVVEKEYYKDNIIPEVDRAELILKFDNSDSPIKIKLGSARKPVWNSSDIDVFNSSGLFLSVRNITVVKIPAKIFGRKKFTPNEKVKFTADLTTFAHAYTFRWNIDFPLKEYFTD